MKKAAWLLCLIVLVPGSRLFARGKQDSSLAPIHKIYVAPMPNGLDEYLKASIVKRLGSRLTLVGEKSKADAILTGTGSSEVPVLRGEVRRRR